MFAVRLLFTAVVPASVRPSSPFEGAVKYDWASAGMLVAASEAMDIAADEPAFTVSCISPVVAAMLLFGFVSSVTAFQPALSTP